MEVLMREVMRHERTLCRWGQQLAKDWAKQRKTNKRLTRAIIVLGAAIFYEDYNLYKSDQRIKALEDKLNETKEKAKENEE